MAIDHWVVCRSVEGVSGNKWKVTGQRLRRRLAHPAWIALLVFVVTAFYVGMLEAPKMPSVRENLWTDRDVLNAFLLLQLAGATLFAGWLLVRRNTVRRQAFERVALWLALGLVLASGLLYFIGRRGLAREDYPHFWDSYHYLLGPKYYSELDYEDLYRCTVQAMPLAFQDRDRVRNLENYGWDRAGALRGNDCRDQFSDARWEAFRADLELYNRRDSLLREVVRDRGYHGTPLHSTIASVVANSFELDYASVTRATLIDVGAVCAAVGYAIRVFGVRVGLLFAAFFFVNFVDRFRITGASFCRYLWYASLVVGICELKRERWRRAGAWIVLSASLNVFPLVFCLGMGVKAAVQVACRRTLRGQNGQFLSGCLVMGALALGVGSLSGRGLSAYRDFFQAMDVHDVGERFPGFGVGLKHTFVPTPMVRGEPSLSDKQKRARIKTLRPVYLLGAAAMIILAGLVAASQRTDAVEATILLGFVTMFCQLETTFYYFAFTSMFALLFHRRVFDSGGGLLLLVALVLNAGFYPALMNLNDFFVFNQVVSTAWTYYALALLTYFAYRAGILQRIGWVLAAPASDLDVLK